jgi:hypothetical protein
MRRSISAIIFLYSSPSTPLKRRSNSAFAMYSGRSAVAGRRSLSTIPAPTLVCSFLAVSFFAALSPKRTPARSAAMSLNEKPLPPRLSALAASAAAAVSMRQIVCREIEIAAAIRDRPARAGF